MDNKITVYPIWGGATNVGVDLDSNEWVQMMRRNRCLQIPSKGLTYQRSLSEVLDTASTTDIRLFSSDLTDVQRGGDLILAKTCGYKSWTDRYRRTVKKDLIPVPKDNTTYSTVPAPSNCLCDRNTGEYVEATGAMSPGIETAVIPDGTLAPPFIVEDVRKVADGLEVDYRTTEKAAIPVICYDENYPTNLYYGSDIFQMDGYAEVHASQITNGLGSIEPLEDDLNYEGIVLTTTHTGTRGMAIQFNVQPDTTLKLGMSTQYSHPDHDIRMYEYRGSSWVQRSTWGEPDWRNNTLSWTLNSDTTMVRIGLYNVYDTTCSAIIHWIRLDAGAQEDTSYVVARDLDVSGDIGYNINPEGESNTVSIKFPSSMDKARYPEMTPLAMACSDKAYQPLRLFRPTVGLPDATFNRQRWYLPVEMVSGIHNSATFETVLTIINDTWTSSYTDIFGFDEHLVRVEDNRVGFAATPSTGYNRYSEIFTEEEMDGVKVCVTWDGSTWKLYVNGVYSTYFSKITSYTTEWSKWWIELYNFTANGIAIFDYIKDDAQIASEKDVIPTKEDDGLVAFYDGRATRGAKYLLDFGPHGYHAVNSSNGPRIMLNNQ